jgi:EpsI family protein
MSPAQTARAASLELTTSAAGRNALLAVLIALCCALLLWPTAQSLHALWTDSERRTYTHGYLVAGMSLLMLARAALSFDRPVTDWRIALLLVPAGLAWLVAVRAGIELLHQVMLPAIAFTAIAATFGLANARRGAVACGYLYFATSVWEVFNSQLQGLSAQVVHVMLGASGIPVHAANNVLLIHEGSFVIDPGCSGMHFFIVALALAVAFGEWHRDTLKMRLLQVAVAAALALLTNWLRIYCVVVAGHLTDMQHYLVRVEHYTFGWCVFAVAMAAFFWFVSRLAPAPGVRSRAAVENPRTGVLFTGAAIALGALAVGPVFGLLDPPRPAAGVVSAPLPELPGWSGPIAAAAHWRPHYPRADRQEAGEYRRAGMAVAAFVAEYDVQRQGKELVGYGNSLFETLVPADAGGVLDSRAGTIRWQKVLDAQGAEAVVAWQWRVGGRVYARGVSAQLGFGLASLQRPVRSSVTAVLARCAESCDRALAEATQLVEALGATRGDQS